MKNSLPYLLLVFCYLGIFPFHLMAQNNPWEWGKQASVVEQDTYMKIEAVDFYNQIYCSVDYSGQLYIGDTVLQGGGTMYGNTALIEYQPDGDISEILNFWGGNVSRIYTETDTKKNLYVGGEFRSMMYIDDTVIYDAFGSQPTHPEVFLAKFDSKKNLIWSGLIHYIYSDNLRGLAMHGDNSIYLLTEHYANTNSSQVIFFDQDTCDPFITPINHVVAVDSNCTIKWRKEIRSDFLGTGTRDLFIGGDGMIYVYGDALGDFEVDGQTFYHPGGSDVQLIRFLLTFDHDGNLVDGFWFQWDVWANFIDIDMYGNLFVSGTLADTAQIGDTLFVTPEGHYYHIFGKFNRELQPIWYHVVDAIPNQTVFFPSIDLNSDHVLIGGSFEQTIEIDGVTMDANGYYTEGVVMKFDNGGNLLNHWITNSSHDLNLWSAETDNCGNLFASGAFMRKSYFGDDTLQTVSYYNKDAFLTKIKLEPDLQVDLGPDTIVCGEYIIEAPDDFEYYIWNDEMTNQNWHLAEESGSFTLAAGTPEGCWAYDTVNVHIQPAYDISLGSDTTIKLSHSAVLTVPDTLDFVQWFDGEISSSFTFNAWEYGVGEHEIWAYTQYGVCAASDSLIVNVEDDTGLTEIQSAKCEVYPNPFYESLIIESAEIVKSVKITSLSGKQFLQIYPDHNHSGYIKMSTQQIPPGVYLIAIESGDGFQISKLVKI